MLKLLCTNFSGFAQIFYKSNLLGLHLYPLHLDD